MCVARPGVHGILWRQCLDSDDDRFPSGGLLTRTGEPKQTMQIIRDVRESILKR
jgi:hypothetical protein